MGYECRREIKEILNELFSVVNLFFHSFLILFTKGYQMNFFFYVRVVLYCGFNTDVRVYLSQFFLNWKPVNAQVTSHIKVHNRKVLSDEKRNKS